MKNYIFSISNDTHGIINSSLLHNEIKNTFSDIIGVTITNDVLTITLESTLESTQLDALTAIVNNHNPINDSDVLPVKDDYYTSRLQLKESFTGILFADLSDENKEIAAKYCLYDDLTLVSFYMSQGLAQADAIIKHKVRRAEDITKAAKTCEARADTCVVKYIAIHDASAFMDAIRNFVQDYKSIAHLGTNYGQDRDGLLDYIEATGSYTNAGLSSYTFEYGTYEDCKNEFKNYLVYGIKPQEFNVFSTT